MVFDRRQQVPHLFQHGGKGIGLPQACEFRLIEFLFLEQAGKQGGQQVHPFPPSRLAPGPQQGSAQFAVHQADGDSPLLGQIGGRGKFRPRLDSCLQPHPLLEGGKNQVGEEKRSLPSADCLHQVEGLPAVPVLQGMPALMRRVRHIRNPAPPPRSPGARYPPNPGKYGRSRPGRTPCRREKGVECQMGFRCSWYPAVPVEV